jgi:chromosome segregation ATPase
MNTQEQITKEKSKLIDIANAMEQKKDEVRRLNVEIKKATALYEEIEEKLTVIGKDKATATEELGSLKSKIKVNEQKVTQLIHEVQTKEKLLEEVKVQHEKTLERSKAEHNALADSLKRTKEGLEHSIEKLTISLSELKSTEIRVREAITVLEQRHKALEIDIESQKGVLASKEEEAAKLTKHIESLTKQINGRNSELLELDETIASKKNELQARTDDVVALEKTIKTLDKKIEKKEQELEVLVAKQFAITKREEALLQRESFIKDTYERAGVAFPEILD